MKFGYAPAKDTGWRAGAAAETAAKAGNAIGSASMALSAGGNAYTEKVNEGYRPEQAQSYATLVGLSEGALQYLLGGISAMGGVSSEQVLARLAPKIEAIDNALMRTVVDGGVRLAVKGTSEGIEEGLQELLEPAFATLILGEEQDWGENFENAAYSFMMGFLASGLIEGIGMAAEGKGKRGFDADAEGYMGDAETDYFSGCETEEEVEARYKDLARKHHPDLGGDAETMANINRQHDMRKAWFAGRAKAEEAAQTREDAAQTQQDAAQMQQITPVETDTTLTPRAETPAITQGRESAAQTQQTAAQMQRTEPEETQAGDAVGEDYAMALRRAGADEDAASMAGYLLQWAEQGATLTEDQREYIATVPGGAGLLEQVQARRETAPLTQKATGTVTADNTTTGGQTDGQLWNGQGQRTGDGLPDGGPGRLPGTGTGEQAGGMAEGAAGPAPAPEQVGAAIERQNRAKDLRRREKVSARDLGIPNGTETPSVTILPEEEWDSELRDTAEKIRQETGLPVTFVLGGIQVRGEDGRPMRVRGVYTKGGIVVQANHMKVTARQIADHEIFHDKANQTLGLIRDIENRIRERYGAEEFDRVVQVYIDNLQGGLYKKLDENATPDEENEAYLIVLEEIFADAYAGINAFGAHAERFNDTVEEVLTERGVGRSREAAQATDRVTGPPEARHSIDESYEQGLDAWDRQGRPDGEVFILGATGDVMQGLGAMEQDIYLRSEKVNAILEKHPEMTLAEIKRIPEILDDPVMVLKSRNAGRGKQQNTRMVLFGTVRAENGQPVLTVLDLRPVESGMVIDDMQKVTSAYTKDNNQVWYMKNSEVLYADEKRTIPLLRTIGFQMPIELQQSGSVGSISYNRQNVNIQGVPFDEVVNTEQEVKKEAKKEVKKESDEVKGLALPTLEDEKISEDSEGRELTAEQGAYFRDSQVRDKDGRLLVVYHQTAGDFTVFDPRHEGAGTRDSGTPFGIFLKTSPRDIGLRGKRQMELYANITNPLRCASREVLDGKLRELSPEYAAIAEEHVSLDNEYRGKFEAAKKELLDFMTQWRKENPDAGRRDLYDVPEFNRLNDAEDVVVEEWTQKADELSRRSKEEITRALKDAGYDGVILSVDAGSFGRSTDAYIAMEPEQVKNVTNTAPTKDPDIRYSVDEDEGLALPEIEAEEAVDQDSLKERQFAIIQESNPADDDYHTWIRSVEDIKTFQETLKDEDWADADSFDPDYTMEMAKEAVRSGQIRVYSSYPIERGTFVTPSRMEAESYAGKGTIHSKVVRLTDVAWIDPTQGQFAPTQGQFAPTQGQDARYSTDEGLDSRAAEDYDGERDAELTAEEEAAILEYKSGGSYQLNAALRDGYTLDQMQYRTMKALDAALEKLPAYRGTVYRRMGFDSIGGQEALDAFLEKHQSGRVVRYHAYTSTSTDLDGYPVEGELTVSLVIEGQSGRDMEGFGNNFESEVLFPRNSRFYIERVETDGEGKPVIYAREVTENGIGQRDSDKRHGKVSGVQETQEGDVHLRGVPEVDPRRGDGQRLPGLRADQAERGTGGGLSRQDTRYSTDEDEDGLNWAVNSQRAQEIEARRKAADERKAAVGKREFKREQRETANREKKPEGKKREKRKPVAESKAIIAKRDLRQNLLGLFSIPEGMRAELGDVIDRAADAILKTGELTQEDRDKFFDRLYAAGVMTIHADEYYRTGRDAIKGGKIYVNDGVKEDFGEDWNDFRKRAFAAGVYLTSNQSDPWVDVWNKDLAEIMPGAFDENELDGRTMLERIIQMAEEGKDEKMSLAEYTAELAGMEHVSEAEILDGVERRMDWALRTFAEKAQLEIELRDRTGVKIAQEREKSGQSAQRQKQREMLRRAKERDRRREQMQRQREARELREMQQRTLKQLQWLSKNRNRAPEELKRAFDEVLGDIDVYAVGAANELNWSNKYQATWKDLAQMYKEAQKSDPNFLPSAELDRVVARLDKDKIGDLDIDALSDLYKAAVMMSPAFAAVLGFPFSVR